MKLRVDPHKYGQSILLAVSGGVDSITMAAAAAPRFDNVHDRLAIAHCNFHLRGTESDEDEAFVRTWAKDRGLECFVQQFDTRSFAARTGQSIEMAARELRYRWFDELCLTEKFDGVCVAHNANDNAETLLLNLLRGTGLKGLCGMSEISRNPFGLTSVFRPMLEIGRGEIEKYASESGLLFRTDSTNLENEVKRNKIRNQIFPILKEINPSFIDTFTSDILHFNQAESIVEDFLSDAEEKLLCGRTVPSPLEVSIPALLSSPHWKYLIFDILHSFGFNSAVIGDLQQSLESGDAMGGKCFEAGEWKAVCSSDRIAFVSSESCGKGIAQFSVKLVKPDPETGFRTLPGTTMMDASYFHSEPVIRKWHPGDWLCPLGMKGKRKKVSDILTDLKLNISEKEEVYVVEGIENHVLAIVGMRIDEAVKVLPTTTDAYLISRE